MAEHISGTHRLFARSTKIWRHQTQPKRGICTCMLPPEWDKATSRETWGINQQEALVQTGRQKWQPVMLEVWAAEPPGAQEIRRGAEPARKARLEDLRVCREQSHAHTNSWITLSVAKQLPDTAWNSWSPLMNKILSSDVIQRKGFKVGGVIENTGMSYGRVSVATGAPLWLCKGFSPPPRNATQTSEHSDPADIFPTGFSC